MTGKLKDTYHAALQHGHAEPANNDLVLGVVQEPMYGIQSHIDENIPELAPSPELLAEFKEKAEKHGHNLAVEAVGFVPRYHEELQDESSQDQVNRIIDALEAGRDVWLVCYENTNEKFCHRTELKSYIQTVAGTSQDQSANTDDELKR
jgi:uncharacterized protein YeaO (DUF488 family)